MKDDKGRMNAILPCGDARWVGDAVRRVASLALMLCALAGFRTAPADARILFTIGTDVPHRVQAFAWQVIETRCNFHRYELEQRSFWAHDARAKRVDAAVVYSIKVLSDVPWRKWEPPAFIEMTVLDDGAMRLAALKSSFITCAP
jgi:hypothetical protein